MATVGLALITNSEAKTRDLVEKYDSYFDKLFITVADKNKTEYNKLKALDNEKIELSYFKWVNHFGKARRFNQSQITTDYWFWMDDDDEIVNPENIRSLVEHMDKNKIEVIFMNYDYFTNPEGEQQANHWRERIIHTASDCKWEEVPCHETVPSKGLADKTELCAVKHHKTIEQMLGAMDRNQKLLEKDWEVNKDPRTAYYLGMTYQFHQTYEKAIEMFNFMIENGGWDEQKVIALNHLSNSYFALEDYEKALGATDEALSLDPGHPDAYFQKVVIYSKMNDYAKAAEWAEMGLTKKINPDSMQLIDPTKYTYRGLFLAAQSNLFVGRPDRAFDYYNQVASVAPHYIQEMVQTSGVDWPRTFAESLNEYNAINSIKFLVNYLSNREGKIDELFKSLPPKLSYDTRLQVERLEAFPPKKWPKKSIVIYCGPGLESWGPDTLDKGMGGSEEAVVYLSRELSKLRWKVTVFCERNTETLDAMRGKDSKGTSWEAFATGESYARYKPWTEFNPHDEFDIFIAWRQPVFADVKARKIFVDLHDTMPEESLLSVADKIDKFMVKSEYHKSLYPNISQEKIKVITNGIFEDLNGY